MALRIIGLNSGITSHGKELADGAVSLMVDGVVKSVFSEERINKKKHSGGFKDALRVTLESNSINPAMIDLVVVSNCCDLESIPDFEGVFLRSKIISCNHHVSHALSAHCSSQFEKSITVVLDGGGNILSNQGNRDWWKEDREQQSYFLIEENEISLLSRDFSSKYEMGFGEVFRAFTRFLGLGSSENAGKLMALSAFGDSSMYRHVKIFEMNESGKVTSALKYSDSCGPQMADVIVRDFLMYHGFAIPDCSDRSLIERCRADIAAWIQEELERVVFEKVKFLSDQYPDFPICISGGVGYNCRSNGNLLRKLNGRKIFFSPFAGDIGQCIGNVCFGNYHINKIIQPIDIGNTFLGTPSNHSIKDVLNKFVIFPDFSDYFITQPENIYESIATLLSSGHVGALHEGRSEVGPRALGNRSIIARGDCSYIRDRVNDIKQREQYMPLAPVLLDTAMHDYFSLYESASYEFMTVAVGSKNFISKRTCGFLHRDGSARIQVVNSQADTGIAKVLNAFSNSTEIPILINTSFNGKSNPISEDIDDSVKYFRELDLDFLAVSGVLVIKNRKVYVPYNLREINFLSKRYINFNLNEGRKLVTAQFGLNLALRKYFVLYEKFCRWFESGNKNTTIRFSGDIDFPVSTHLPMYENENYEDEVNLKYLTHVYIWCLDIKKFSDLSHIDAINDGFENLDQLKRELVRIYGEKITSGIITIYHIKKSTFMDKR